MIPQVRWRGPRPSPDGEQVANAHDSFVVLDPVSGEPAELIYDGWSALLPDQDIPLISEESRDA